MTNEEAVSILEKMWAEVEYYEETEALDMAISALSNSQNQTESLIRTSTDSVIEADVIYRQQAIDAVKTYWSKVVDDIPKGTSFEEVTQLCDMALEHNANILKAIDQLPSAQPTLYGYPVEHLAMIARVLQKENFPPERIAEILSDVGLIVGMVRDEFEETLKETLKKVTERRSDERSDKQTGCILCTDGMGRGFGME